ncbi:MAG: hypothetical protein RR505_13355 [Raoultibacter sp.]
MLTIHCEQALPDGYPEGYEDMTYDGCWFYIIAAGQQRILKLDCDFKIVEYVDTCRCYSCICYDPSDHCFWAACNRCESTLFQLDENLSEIGCTKLELGSQDNIPIQSISGCCVSNQLLIAVGHELVMVDKDHPTCSLSVATYPEVSLQGALSIYPYMIGYYTRNHCQYLGIWSSYGCLQKEYEVPDDIWIKSVLLFPCTIWDDEIHFKMLACDGTGRFAIMEFVIESDILGCLDKCNYLLRREDCGGRGGANAVMESIALMEASLAHILNAEGEKIQKAVAEASDICQLLEVNKSVRETLICVTHLEQTLYDKLHVLTEIHNF